MGQIFVIIFLFTLNMPDVSESHEKEIEFANHVVFPLCENILG